MTSRNITVVLSHITVPSMIAYCMCFIVTAGRLDLSLGAVMVIASNVGALGALRFGYAGLFVGAVGSSVIMLLINTLLVQALKMPAWVTGLGMAMVYEGIASIYSASLIAQGGRVAELGGVARQLGRMPSIFIAAIVGFVIAYLIFNRTSWGVNIRAIGGGPAVASMMGISVRRTEHISGLLGGLFMGFASMVNISSAGVLVPTTGLTTLSSVFQPLAIYFLANAFSRWLNLTVGVLMASTVIMGLFNFLTRAGVPSGTWQDIILGASIVLFGLLSQRGNKEVVK